MDFYSKGFSKFSKEVREWGILEYSWYFFYSKGFSKVFKGGKRMGQFGMLGARVLIYCSEFGDTKKRWNSAGKNRTFPRSFVLKVFIRM